MIRVRHLALLVPVLLLGLHAPADAARKVRAHKPKATAAAPAAGPCTDFYEYANAAWLKANPAPPQGSVSAFQVLRAHARAQQRALLDDLARAPTDDAGRALGTLWSEGMNQTAVDGAGSAPLQPLFERIGRLKKPRDVAAAIAALHAAGMPVLFNFSDDADLQDPSLRIGYATQGGLGLPDPAYYTRGEAQARDLLGRYRAYIQTILQLSGTPADRVGTESGWVLSMEMQLAQASVPAAQAHGAEAYHPTPVAALEKDYKALAPGKFLSAQRVKADTISLGQPGFFRAADAMLASVPVEQWQAYLRFHVASAMAPYLSQAFVDAHFQMYGRLLAGREQAPDRGQRVMDAIDRALGPTMGHAWAQRYLPAASRALASQVVAKLRKAVADGITANGWMDAPTRAIAQTKLSRLEVEIGEPKVAPAAIDASLGKGYATDLLALAQWRHQLAMAAIGTHGDSAWPMPAQNPAINYDPLHNRILVTAALLQPPVLDAGKDSAQAMGSLGALLGRTLQEAIAGSGRGVDADGRIRDWWTPASTAAFVQATAPIIAQYDRFRLSGGAHVDGTASQAANLADLGGVELAWAGFNDALPAKPGNDAERAFFQAYAQVWAETQHASVTDPGQVPARYRVNGVLANLPGFAKAYACKAGQPMLEANPVKFWN